MRYHNYSTPRRDKENRSGFSIAIGAVALIAALAVVIFLTISRAAQPAKDILVVGTSTGFPPFEMRFGEEIRGLDVDLCGKVAEALGKKMIIRDLDFDALLPSLGRGASGEKPLVDIVCSAVTKTRERDEVVDFSDTYFVANQAVLTTKDKNLIYSSPQDLAGLVVAYQEGTTSQDWVEANILQKVKISRHVSFSEMLVGLQALGRDFDAIIIDEPAARVLAKSRSHLVVAGVIETKEEYSFAVAEGDPHKIVPSANKVLKTMRETGEYDKLQDRWFGSNVR